MLMGEVQRTLRGCQSVLDVGCGNMSPLRFLKGLHTVGMDGYPPALEEARKNETHDEFILGDVRSLDTLVKGRKFDACIALDVIEHLPKEEGWKMLDAMEALANRRVIIFTPNGFIPQKSKDGDLQEHLSGWTAPEMRARGYEVHGMYGPKHLRGEYHRIKRNPRAFWVLVSIAMHYLSTRAKPEASAAIFCTKTIRG